MIVHSVSCNALRDAQNLFLPALLWILSGTSCKYKKKSVKTTDFCSEFYGFSFFIILFSYIIISDVFTLTFCPRSPPSWHRSDGYLRAHGCRTGIRSYGRSWSGFWNRRPGRHPSRAPDVRNRRSRPATDSHPHNNPDSSPDGSVLL